MRTVYATSLELAKATDAAAALDSIGRWIEDWYRRRRLTIDVAGALVNGEAILTPTHGHQLSIRTHASQQADIGQLTDIRWCHPDQYDQSLGWVTSLSLLRQGERLLVSIEVAVTGLQLVIAPASIKLGSPRVVRDISQLRSVSLGGHPYNVTPELIGAEDVDALVGKLLDTSRPYPIVLVSRRLPDDFPLVDAGDLAERLAGAAKVYELSDKWAGYRLTEELGKPMSCYGGAIRLYWPGFHAEADPHLHPLWMPWQLKDAGTSERSLHHLCNMIFDAAAFRHVEPTAISRVRLAAEREAREAARSSNSRSDEELIDDLIRMEQKLKDAEAARAELVEENRTLRENTAALTAYPAWTTETATPTSAIEVVADAKPLASVAEAVRRAETVAGSVRYLPSAHASAEDSPYKQPERVAQALSALEEVAAIWATTIETGRAGRPIRELFKQRGFDYSDDVSQTSKGKWGDEYETVYDNQKLDIAPHITLGAKQADTCISIHWAWHRAEKVALVAHVGRHKTNTKT